MTFDTKELPPYRESSMGDLLLWEIEDALLSSYAANWKRWGSVMVRNAEVIAGGNTLAIRQIRGYSGPGSLKTDMELRYLDGKPVEGQSVSFKDKKEIADNLHLAFKAFDLICQVSE